MRGYLYFDLASFSPRKKRIGGLSSFPMDEHSCRKIVDLDENKHCSKLQAAEQTVVGGGEFKTNDDRVRS